MYIILYYIIVYLSSTCSPEATAGSVATTLTPLRPSTSKYARVSCGERKICVCIYIYIYRERER